LPRKELFAVGSSHQFQKLFPSGKTHSVGENVEQKPVCLKSFWLSNKSQSDEGLWMSNKRFVGKIFRSKSAVENVGCRTKSACPRKFGLSNKISLSKKMGLSRKISLSKEMLGVEQNQPVQENGTVDQK
jgi:hypothetical protein